MVASGEPEADYAYEVALNGQPIAAGEANPDTVRQSQTLRIEVADLFRDELNRLAIGRAVFLFTTQMRRAAQWP